MLELKALSRSFILIPLFFTLGQIGNSTSFLRVNSRGGPWTLHVSEVSHPCHSLTHDHPNSQKNTGYNWNKKEMKCLPLRGVPLAHTISVFPLPWGLWSSRTVSTQAMAGGGLKNMCSCGWGISYYLMLRGLSTGTAESSGDKVWLRAALFVPF